MSSAVDESKNKTLKLMEQLQLYSDAIRQTANTIIGVLEEEKRRINEGEPQK